MRRILLADPSRDCQLALLETLAPEDRLECCSEGQKALELLGTFQPDVLILDLRLADVDGTWVLRRASERERLPTTIVTGYYFSVDMLRLMERYGVSAVVYKTYQPHCLLELVEDLLSHAPAREIRQISAQDWISNTLISLGTLTSQSGFRYLRDGIRLKIEDPSVSMTKVLYPTIAKRYSVSTAAVEKAMRTAIQTAFHRGDRTQWRLYFSADQTGSIPQPTNTCFMSTLAESCPVKSVP